MIDLDDDKIRLWLEKLVWRARIDRDVLKAASASPEDRASATDTWACLYRLVKFDRDESDKERARLIDYLESLAAKAGISRLSFYLSEFALDIGHAQIMGYDPLGGPLPEGRKERPLSARIEIAAAVQRLRDSGMSVKKSCKEVAETTNPRISADAVRRIYENATKTEAGSALVRLVAAGAVEF
jgi:hypothetical protein